MATLVEQKQLMPILLYLGAGIFGAWGQFFYKMGGLQIGTVPWHRNWPIFTGFGLFCVVMVLFLTAFRLGGRMAVVYPVYATTFVWGTLIAAFVAKEPVNVQQVVGLVAIMSGVLVVCHAK